MDGKFKISVSTVVDVDLRHFVANSLESALVEQRAIFDDPWAALSILENSLSAEDLDATVELVQDDLHDVCACGCSEFTKPGGTCDGK